jgi:hypothetical protein
MSAVISDADFAWDMYALHMNLGEQCYYSQQHKLDPTRTLREMIRDVTLAREESEMEATKRAMEDWAWEAELEAEAEAEAEAAWEAAKAAWEAEQEAPTSGEEEAVWEQEAAPPGEGEAAKAHEVEGYDSP